MSLVEPALSSSEPPHLPALRQRLRIAQQPARFAQEEVRVGEGLVLDHGHRPGLDRILAHDHDVASRLRPASLIEDAAYHGGHAQRVARGLSDAVHVVGRVDGDLRLAAYSAADVLALTSWSEGIPNAVLEACAAGTPVLISDRCNVPEVAAFSAGRIVPVSPAPVAAALGAMLADRVGLESMGANGRRMIRERFGFSTVIDRLEHLYDRLARLDAAADQCRTDRQLHHGLADVVVRIGPQLGPALLDLRRARPRPDGDAVAAGLAHRLHDELFEVVEGAVLEVRGEPGQAVEAMLEVETPLGRVFRYRAKAVTDAQGLAQLRVPYATDTALPTRPLGPYRVEIGEEVHLLTVTDADVTSGALIGVESNAS